MKLYRNSEVALDMFSRTSAFAIGALQQIGTTADGVSAWNVAVAAMEPLQRNKDRGWGGRAILDSQVEIWSLRPTSKMAQYGYILRNS